MKRINIFKSGTHTSMGGQTLAFTEDDLQRAADAYDPAVHEAPIVVGHPRTDDPAYGWISGLQFADGGLDAVPTQVEEQFQEMVKAGRFKHVSAAFYTPDSPLNPKPGAYYLRHVGFLGAQPPAVKGLKPIEFSEAEEGVIVFAAPGPFESHAIARLFRGLRDFMIDKFDTSAADQALPAMLVEDLEARAREPEPEKTVEPAGVPASFAEPPAGGEGNTMTEEEIRAAQAKLEADRKALADQEAAFAETQRQADERRRAELHATNLLRLDELVKAGKILPAEQHQLGAFLEVLDPDQELEFSEGADGGTVKRRAVDALLKFLDGLPPRVEFGELTGGDKGPGQRSTDPLIEGQRMAAAALRYQEEQAAKGITITSLEAVQAVKAEQAQQ